MYSKIQLSMEHLPRQKGFGCLSLKFGCIFSGLLLILYCVLALAKCAALLVFIHQGDDIDQEANYTVVIFIGIIHCVTMLFTTMMLIGAIRERHQLMKPWIIWMSCQLTAGLLLFLFWTTMAMIHHSQTSLVVYIVDFMSLLIRFYMLVLVSSYAKDLEEELGNDRLKRLLEADEPKYSAV
ncbi:unnamed protein product [Arctia plantaginis]|uniref:Uncharacterized protein n=1 Tax=Arctia plantaginis TaxID=874455 RepID=A0A8S0ZBU6_ARCPL|nr:unnamed protein product [Arctia plantaginis]CAB3228317.1 unnamed protein product [Arctia plantaginis]